MFGYVTFNRQELKFKDYETYRSYYCGLCRELRERYGIPGQISLTYDMTFVILLLDGVYEPRTRVGTTRCVVHPFLRHTVRKNQFTEYAADMNVILSYYKCRDDWQDEKDALKLAYSGLLAPGLKKTRGHYQDKIKRITDSLQELSDLEKAGVTDLDKAAGCSGRILEEVLAPCEDEWSGALRRMGFYLGKFVYLMDAYEDVEKDIRNQSYNPLAKAFAERGGTDAFDQETKRLLVMMLSDACREFESLPILRHGEILRNILYSGVWTRFDMVSRKRGKEREKKEDA